MARVMVVDDSVAVRRIIAKILVFAGHEVVCEAGDSETAVELYGMHMPDVVTMDIKMRGTDGIQSARQILQIDPEARIIMITAVGDQDYVLESMRLGARQYLVKPIQADRLVSVVNDVMAGSGPTTSAA